jgi:hypothetical protein
VTTALDDAVLRVHSEVLHDSGVVQSRQGWIRTLVVRCFKITGSPAFRLAVRRDHYLFQSSANADIWLRDRGWTQVLALPPSHPALEALPIGALLVETKEAASYALFCELLDQATRVVR